MALRDGKPKLSPSFAKLFQTRLVELGSNPREFAKSIPTAYDPIRKIHNGEVFPGEESVGRPGLLTLICDKLNLDLEYCKGLVEMDRDYSQGKISLDLLDALDKDPEIVQLGIHFKRLSDRDKKEIMNLVKSKANN